MKGLTSAQRASWEREGFFIVPGFGLGLEGAPACEAMHARAVELAREADGAGMAGRSLVQPEAKPNPRKREPEDGVSKIFKLHRDEDVFRSFIQGDTLLDLGAGLIGHDLDCFLSQFIFKNAGALGQPWHQDSYYFPFDRSPQVGLWLAVTEATLENGCLHVLPGSHHEPVHRHVRDRREHANHGYVEIVDHDMTNSIPVELKPGDLLVFHSHLMHRSTDNLSSGLRAAMVYHLAQAGTVDEGGQPVPINDWMPVRRRIETGTEIAAPLERVWQVLTDAAGYSEWNPYLVKIDGAISPGADIVAHSQAADGQEMAIPVRVVSVDCPLMRWQGGLPDHTQFKGDHFFELEAIAGDRTLLHHYENFSGSLIETIVGARRDAIRENFERMNEGLRAHCEAD